MTCTCPMGKCLWDLSVNPCVYVINKGQVRTQLWRTSTSSSAGPVKLLIGRIEFSCRRPVDAVMLSWMSPLKICRPSSNTCNPFCHWYSGSWPCISSHVVAVWTDCVWFGVCPLVSCHNNVLHNNVLFFCFLLIPSFCPSNNPCCSLKKSKKQTNN